MKLTNRFDDRPEFDAGIPFSLLSGSPATAGGADFFGPAGPRLMMARVDDDYEDDFEEDDFDEDDLDEDDLDDLEDDDEEDDDFEDLDDYDDDDF